MSQRRISRRQALAGAGSVSLGALIAACGGDDDGQTSAATQTESTSTELLDGAGSCTVTPELTEGPYYIDVDKVRSDIREGRPGAELKLALRVRDAGSCEPIANAVVELWHCDALGDYSGFDADGTFLRGAQVTGRDGVAEFTTVYPGFYMGRTVHIHAKVLLDNESALTTQLFFDDDVSDRVFQDEPYAQHGERDQRNDSDGIFDEQLVVDVKQSGGAWIGALNFDVRRA